MPHALIVDDDISTREALSEIILAEGFTSTMAGSIRDAKIQLGKRRTDVMFIDLKLPDGSGMDLLDEATGLDRTDIILITGPACIDSAAAALHRGAVDYLSKPINLTRLKRLLARVPTGVDEAAPRWQVSDVPAAAAQYIGRFGQMLGEAPVMKKLADQICRVAPTDATVLLSGESGTGKELAARSVHDLSRRKDQLFLPINCGAISPQLIESELFGHEKGSFTGASRQHKGYFERASGGTLFLDEITEMSDELQVKLLRVLESGSVMRIGGTVEIATDVRIIAATNRDPDSAVGDGLLRLDLFHRLNVFPLCIPPLRERGDDIALLARHFLSELNQAHGTHKVLSREAMTRLKLYAWPGNVRELHNILQRAYILSDQILDAVVPAPTESVPVPTGRTLAIPVGTSLAQVDRKLICATLELCGGVKKRAAEMLGISLKTLYNRLEEYGKENSSSKSASSHNS